MERERQRLMLAKVGLVL